MVIFTACVQLFFGIYILIFYAKTKHHSVRYKHNSRIIARTLFAFFIIDYLISFVQTPTEINYFIIALITFTIMFVIFKLHFRTSQTLADINWQRGSSIIKGKFHISTINWRYILLINLALALWTCIVFSICNPILNQELIDSNPIFLSSSRNVSLIFHAILIAPITEELIYRFLYPQLFLYWTRKVTKSKYVQWIIIILPTLYWTYLHNNIFINSWVKYIQILPLGLVCIYTAYKKDIEHSVLIHIVFNIIATILTLVFENIWFG